MKRKVVIGVILAAVAGFAAWISVPAQTAHATTCFKKDEYVSGMNKVCIYNCLGSDYAVTQSAVSLCPLTIDR